MSALDLKTLRNDLRTRAKTAAAFNALVTAGMVQAENTAFNPPADATWARDELMVASEIRVASGLMQITGLMIFDLRVPANRGTETVEVLSAALASVFESGSGMVGTFAAPADIHFDRCERKTGRVVEQLWFSLPVYVTWRCYAAANV